MTPFRSHPFSFPLDRPGGWLDTVNEPLTDAALVAVRRSVARGRPFGTDDWARSPADRLGLGFTLRDHGRPRKAEQR